MNPLGPVVFAALAFGTWGVVPVYWHQINNVSTFEVVAQRIIWSPFFLFFLLLYQRRVVDFARAVRAGGIKAFGWCALSAALIGANWFAFNYAV
jgi:chloramphenicol-sensitive protein RarD